MKTKNFFLGLIPVFVTCCACAQSSWALFPGSPSAGGGRIDDVCFINRDTGWCATSGGRIFRTNDSGQTWESQINLDNVYFRAIEFRNANLGFAGTLNSSFLRSTDGGANWTDITAQIASKPEAVCGISIPSDSTVFAVGQWDEPAFILKSTDAGQNWESKDMSAFAKGLVDVLFVSPDTGWVSGKGIGGGTILHTTDGGATWTELFNTGTNGDYVWKLQRVTSIVWVASVQSIAGASGRFVKSMDGGLTWFTMPAPLSETQGIGFATPDLGWLGGYINGFYKTTDGGANWVYEQFGGNFNRFFFIDSTHAFASGYRIYKFSPTSSAQSEPVQHFPDSVAPFAFTLWPNPTAHKTRVGFELERTDNIRISVLDQKGTELKRLYRGRLPAGSHVLDLDVEGLAPGQYLIWLQRNHGLHLKPFVKM